MPLKRSHGRWCPACRRHHGTWYVCPSYSGEIVATIHAERKRFFSNPKRYEGAPAEVEAIVRALLGDRETV